MSYADDLKMLGVFNKNESGSTQLQNDLVVLNNWTTKWSTELNVPKCKTMHIGVHTDRTGYIVPISDGGVILKETLEEKDLGVVVSNDLKWNKKMLICGFQSK